MKNFTRVERETFNVISQFAWLHEGEITKIISFFHYKKKKKIKHVS